MIGTSEASRQYPSVIFHPLPRLVNIYELSIGHVRSRYLQMVYTRRLQVFGILKFIRETLHLNFTIQIKINDSC